VARLPMTLTGERPLQIGGHVIVALAIALVAPFTGFAWPFAIATGSIIGQGSVEKAHGVSAPLATRLIRVLAVTGGVLAMLVAGVLVGGLIAFLVTALAAFSERLAADASPTDRGLARIVLFWEPLYHLGELAYARLLPWSLRHRPVVLIGLMGAGKSAIAGIASSRHCSATGSSRSTVKRSMPGMESTFSVRPSPSMRNTG